jgi:carboxylate-amine ligase
MAADMDFCGSSRTTLGVELELQIIDRETGDLAPGAMRILDSCEDENVPGVSGEFLLSMLEVKTGICVDVAEVRNSLFPRLRTVRHIASSLGYDIAIGGTHPFARPCMAAVFPEERYQKIQKRQGWMAYQEAVFGLHIHVGIPTGDDVIGVTNLLIPVLPHLLALSANSPFWHGVDTAYASTRLRMFRPSGSAGLPPHFVDWNAFCEYFRTMQQAGVYDTSKDLYWDIRPQPTFGTIELRIFDAPASLSCVLGLCALVRCLVAESLALLEEDPELRRGDVRSYWLATENRWLATRFGMLTRCCPVVGGRCETLSDGIQRLVERLRPIAESLGENKFLNAINTTPSETGSERQRHLYRQHGSWLPVLEDMKHRWMQEVEDAFPLPAISMAS